jgi:hypothetical protein
MDIYSSLQEHTLKKNSYLQIGHDLQPLYCYSLQAVAMIFYPNLKAWFEAYILSRIVL